MSLRPEGEGTEVEQVLREYQEGLEEENLAKVSRLMNALRRQRLDYLSGPCAAVLALVYHCDKPLFSRLVAASADPAFIHLVITAPEYAYDLEALWMIAEHGGLWARIEVFHRLIELLRESTEANAGTEAAGENSALSRALRRVIAVYLGRVIMLLLATKKPGVLGYLLDALSAIYRGGSDSFMLYFFGKSVGKGISLYLSEADLKQQLGSWEPSHSASGLMYLLYGAQLLLEGKNVRLMGVLNRSLLGKGLARVWKAYRGGNDVEAGALPFTSLDLPVWQALAQRWKTRSRTLRFLNGVCRRLQAVEGMWFSDLAAEAKRRNALYAALRAHARAWSMLPPEEGTEGIPAMDLLRSYIADQRNWEANRERGVEMPGFLSEILACLASPAAQRGTSLTGTKRCV